MSDRNVQLTSLTEAAALVPGGRFKRGHCSSLLNTPPEVLAKQPYDEKCDLWQIGVILFYLFVGDFPFRGDSEEEFVETF